MIKELITEKVTDGPLRVINAWSMTPKKDLLGLEVGASLKEVISGVEDWGIPRRMTRTDGGLWDIGPFKVLASVRMTCGELSET